MKTKLVTTAILITVAIGLSGCAAEKPLLGTASPKFIAEACEDMMDPYEWHIHGVWETKRPSEEEIKRRAAELDKKYPDVNSLSFIRTTCSDCKPEWWSHEKFIRAYFDVTEQAEKNKIHDASCEYDELFGGATPGALQGYLLSVAATPAYAKRRMHDGRADFEKVYKSTPPDYSLVLAAQAKEQGKPWGPEKLIELHRQGVTADPPYGDIKLNNLVSYLYMGDWQTAAKMLSVSPEPRKARLAWIKYGINDYSWGTAFNYPFAARRWCEEKKKMGLLFK